MENDSYKTNAYKLLDSISDRDLRKEENFAKIKAMIEARALFLWEINDDILRLKLLHPELIEEGEKYTDSGWVKQKWFKEGEYHWMYQLRPAPERAEDYNDYFTRAIYERNNVYIAHFLHYYEGILNRRAERFIETFAIASRYFVDLKLTFVSILWEEFLKYDPANPIPLLQITKPKVSHAWHKMVAKQIGALTVNEKVYANWRKISVIAKKYREENLPLEQFEEKIRTELKTLTKRDIRYALRMLPGWRDALPISYKLSPEHNHGYEPRCVYADTLPDTGAELLNRRRFADEKHKLPWRTLTTWFPKVETDMIAERILQPAGNKICTQK